MGAPGGLYRPTPRGYNGNPTGRGAQPSVPPTSDFSADWWGPPTGLVRSRQATSAAGGSCRLLITVAVLLMMQAWSWGCGNSPAAWRAITVATPHLFLINVAWAWGRARPTPVGSDWRCPRRLPRSRSLVGPAAYEPYRQAVMGVGPGTMVLMSGPAGQQCHAAGRSSQVRRAVAVPVLGKGRGVGFIVATPLPRPPR